MRTYKLGCGDMMGHGESCTEGYYCNHCGDKVELEKEIDRLKEKGNLQANILRRLAPERFPGVLFIHSMLGELDQNGMPDKILVVPGYGVDFSYVYEKTGQTTGTEW